MKKEIARNSSTEQPFRSSSPPDAGMFSEGFYNTLIQDLHVCVILREDGSEYPQWMRPGARAVRSRSPVRNESWVVRRPESNQAIWLYGTAVPQFTQAGALERVIVTATDITDRRKVESALQRANELNRLILS